MNVLFLKYLGKINEGRYHMMKMKRLWENMIYILGGDLCPQQDSSHQQNTKNPKLMLVVSRWPPHTSSSLLPRDALLFRSGLPVSHCKSHLARKLWLGDDAEKCTTSLQSRLSACAHKEEKCIDSLIERYTVPEIRADTNKMSAALL